MERKLIDIFKYIVHNETIDHKEMRKKNYEYTKLFLYFGLAYSVLNLLFQGFVIMHIKIRYLVLMLAMFIVFLMIYNHQKEFVSKHATGFAYTVSILSLLLTSMMGSVWNPSTVAVAFYVFLIAAPSFIFDQPLKHIVHILCSTFIFIIFIALFEFKDHYTTFRIDLFASISFCFASIVLNQLLNFTRLQGIQYDERLRHSVEYDPVTSLKNEYALRHDEENYYHKNIYVAFFEIEDVHSLRSFFGLTIGDEVDIRLIKALKDYIHYDFIYRFNKSNLIILGEASNEEFVRTVQQVKDEFKRSIKAYNESMDVSLSVGYVYGMPMNHDGFNRMVQVAYDNVHKAEKEGHDRIVGEVFHAQNDHVVIQNRLTNERSEDIDPMTNTMTLIAFRMEAKELVSRLTGKKVVLYVNIDGLKSYNETFGYEAGDDLIIHLANQLQLQFDQKYIARLGEDHFALLTNDSHLKQRVEKVAKSMATFNPKEKVFICVGAYIFNEGDSIIQACDRAKMACDVAKTSTQQVLHFYDTKLSEEAKYRNYILTHVEEAAQNDYLTVYYQGVVDTKTKTTCGAEALVRWNDPIYGWIYPDRFIPTLEEANLIHIVDLYVLEHVCMRIRERLNTGKIVYPVSINLSRQDFYRNDLYDRIIAIVEKYNTPLKDLHLEVTERMMASKSSVIFDTLHKLKEYGFAIWMDDFGSEYSSLNMMSKFHFDVIKLDMYFMRNFDASENSKILIQSIIELAKKMGEKTLCEGVENEEQYAFLRSVHCDMIQGYYFFKPESEDKFLKKAEMYDNRREN